MLWLQRYSNCLHEQQLIHFQSSLVPALLVPSLLQTPPRQACWLLLPPPSTPLSSWRSLIGWNVSHHKTHFPHKGMQSKRSRWGKLLWGSSYTYSFDRWCYGAQAHPPPPWGKYCLSTQYTIVGLLSVKYAKVFKELCISKLYSRTKTDTGLAYVSCPIECLFDVCNWRHGGEAVSAVA